MTQAARDVLITGLGLVSSLGEGVEAHVAQLGGASAPQPTIEAERFAPYFLHPLPQIDWSRQIPKKGDQRQMETWQKLGVYAAGLALEDAGIPADEAMRAGIDMIVSAGGGERDPEVDALIMSRARGLADPQPLMNELLSSELRPTVQFQLGLQQFEAQDYMKAAVTFTQVLADSATDEVRAASRYNLALCQRQLGSPDEAKATLLKYREEHPRDERTAEIAYQLGDLLEAGGSSDAAIAQWRPNNRPERLLCTKGR